MTPRDNYRYLVKSLAEHFKKHGFLKRGNTFHYKEHDNWLLISIQKSTKSSHENIVFTINIGVVSGILLKYYDDEDNNSIPSLEDSHLRRRLAYFIDGSDDFWWHIDDSVSISSLLEEVISALDSKTMEDIKRQITNKFLVSIWKRGLSPGLTNVQRLLCLAIMEHANNDRASFELVKDELLCFVEGKAAEFYVKNNLRKLSW